MRQFQSRFSTFDKFASPLTDAILYATPWDFDIENIEKEIYIFHGKQDSLVKLEAVLEHAKRIKNKKEYYSDGNHFEVASRADQVLELLR